MYEQINPAYHDVSKCVNHFPYDTLRQATKTCSFVWLHKKPSYIKTFNS